MPQPQALQANDGKANYPASGYRCPRPVRAEQQALAAISVTMRSSFARLRPMATVPPLCPGATAALRPISRHNCPSLRPGRPCRVVATHFAQKEIMAAAGLIPWCGSGDQIRELAVIRGSLGRRKTPDARWRASDHRISFHNIRLGRVPASAHGKLRAAMRAPPSRFPIQPARSLCHLGGIAL